MPGPSDKCSKGDCQGSCKCGSNCKCCDTAGDKCACKSGGDCKCKDCRCA